MRYFSLAALVALAAVTAAGAQGPAGPSGGQDVFYFGKDGPVLLRVQVEIDGKLVQEVYRDHLKKLFAFLDRDGDGLLSSQELKHLPSGQFLTTMLRNGYPYFNKNMSLKMSDLGKGPDDKISLDDLAAYLEKQGIASFAQVPSYANYTPKSLSGPALFKALDTDGDGKLSKKELQAAKNILKKFDLDGDELLTQQELTGSPNPYVYNQPVPLPPVPGGGGVMQPAAQAASTLYLVPPNALVQTASMILARYDKNKDLKLDRAESGLSEAMFHKLDRDKDGFLALSEVMHWTQHIEPITVVVRAGALGKNQGSVTVTTPAAKLPKGLQVGQASPGLDYLRLGETKLSFAGVTPPSRRS